VNKRSFLAIAFPCLFAACAFGYQARGKLSDVDGEMRGKAYPANNGGGRFVLSDQSGILTCDGMANTPSISLQPGSCEGEQGNGVLHCSDGRVVHFDWQASSCRSLRGSGSDAQGNRLEFRVERR
jgi:hypothetical protein